MYVLCEGDCRSLFSKEPAEWRGKLPNSMGNLEQAAEVLEKNRAGSGSVKRSLNNRLHPRPAS